jgi:glutamate synthase (NADPH/NADH) large chain
MNYDESWGWKRLCATWLTRLKEAVRGSGVLLVLSDRNIAPGKLPAHASLVTGAIHRR